jgi:outer membrane protein OmpA-like peptidoglycan-associated protein
LKEPVVRKNALVFATVATLVSACAAQDERNRALLESRTREAQNAKAQAQAAQQQLQDLQARQTERGMVVTLGDVLFDTNKATLKPGADQRIDRLAGGGAVQAR